VETGDTNGGVVAGGVATDGDGRSGAETRALPLFSTRPKAVTLPKMVTRALPFALTKKIVPFTYPLTNVTSAFPLASIAPAAAMLQFVQWT